MVNLKKIVKMAELSFVNAQRLHFDSIYLFRNKSYPSAFFLSVLAQEEMGKFFLLDDFVWHSRIDGRYPEDLEVELVSQIFSHPIKQKQFILKSGAAIDNSLLYKNFVRDVFSNSLEIKKQNAIYVGLPKNKGKLNIKGKIINPSSVTKEKAEKQITIINDNFLDFIYGVYCGYYICDNDNLDKKINRKILQKMDKTWKLRGKFRKTINFKGKIINLEKNE